MAAGFCPSVVPPRDEIDKYKELSLRLYKVMEKLGACIQFRDAVKEIAIFREISRSICYQAEYYIFGSTYEGTYIYCYKCDQDIVQIESDMPVVTKVANSTGDLSFLLLLDRNPGYVKLQKISKGVPQSVIRGNFVEEFHHTYRLKNDSHGKVYLVRDFKQMYPAWHRRGPATTISITKTLSQDFVSALNCGTWPECASAWLTRQRDNGWPTPDLIEKCESLGFLVVPACHPKSDEKELQWRISFSHQERLLVTQFNSVQLKCYILLKFIRKEIVREIPEETLTSYHCKTCMFYVMENTPNDFWVPENLASCLIMCLRQIKEWVSNGNCPNYFIPEENMFDRITNKNNLMTLTEGLNKILDSDLGGQLEKVLPAEIVEKLQGIKDTDLGEEDTWAPTDNIRLMKVHEILCTSWRAWKSILWLLCDEQEIAIKYLRLKLKETQTIGNHTETEVSSVRTHILPFFQLTLLSYIVVEKISAGESKTVIQEILEDTQCDELDCMTGSAKLKQATAMLMLGENQKSLKELSIDNFDNIAICSCGNSYIRFQDIAKLTKKTGMTHDTDIKLEEYLRKILTPCVPYSPHEKQIVPIAIQYEMIRAFGRYDELECFDLWYILGTVDGKFLKLFLLYLNHKALGDKRQATKNLRKMIKLLNTDDCTHRETCLNLLGWVHKERGKIDLAVQCFQKSLKVNSSYNAAFWHFCFLICGY